MTFKNWLKNSVYKDVNPLSIKILACNNSSLTDLKGIEEFKNLEYFYCSWNSLTNLKGVEKLTNLKELRCFGNNKLTSLKEIQYLTNLKELYCNTNNLEHKDYDIFGSIKIKDYQQYLKKFYRKERIKNLI